MSMRIVFEDGDGMEWTNVEAGTEDAQFIGAYWHAVADFLSADPEDEDYEEVIENLHTFDDLEIDGRYVMTDEGDLEDLANEGELAFDDLYEEG